MKTTTESQSALRAMDMYFKSPSRLRTDAAGDIYTAGRFELLFDRMGERIKAIVIAGYEPPNWQAKAHDAILQKLQQNLALLLRPPETASDAEVRDYAATLLTNISDRLEGHSAKVGLPSWQVVLANELAVLETSDTGRAMSNAMRVLSDISQLGSPAIEGKILHKLGAEGMDFIRLTDDGQKQLDSACIDVIAKWLSDSCSVPQQHCHFAASAVMHAVRNYHLTLPQSMKLLNLPAALAKEKAKLDEATKTTFICKGIARTISRQLGVPDDKATKLAPYIERRMRRYGLDWEEALALTHLTSHLASRLPQLGNDSADMSIAPDYKLTLSDVDKARAVQQVMQRDGCDVETALRVVARRIRALPEICLAFPEAARPGIVSGMPARLSCALSESSCELFSHAVRTLEKEKKTGWRAPNSPVDIPVSDLYLLDSIRSLKLALKDHRGFQLFDERDADSLTPAIHAFAGDDQVMTAICDSCNQTIMGSILSIIQHKELALADRSPFVPLPPDEETGHETRRLWHCAAIEDNDYLVIRHLYLEKTWQVLKPMSSDVWTINKGQDWQGDVSPMNAGWTADFSYAFKLSELKQGIRNPQLRRCQYTLAVDLDWDTIDATLAAREGSQPRQALAHGIPQ